MKPLTKINPTETDPPNDEPTDSTRPPAASNPVRVRYRIRFAKKGLLRWISHRDLARLWERLLRRASLKLSMTEGFHPKPRVAFPSALALGVESEDEVVEIELAEELGVNELFDRLAGDRQPGLGIHSVHRLPDGFGKAQLQSTDYLITVPDEIDLGGVRQSIQSLLAQSEISFERKNKKVTVSVPEQVLDLHVDGRQLKLTLAASATASLRPGDVLENINASNWIEQGALITRTKVVLLKEFETDDPALAAFASDQNATGDLLADTNPSIEHRNRPRPSAEDSSDGPSGPNARRGESYE